VKLEPPNSAGRKVKIVQQLWETFWQSLQVLNIGLPSDEAIPLLGIIPRELKIYVHTKTCT